VSNSRDRIRKKKRLIKRQKESKLQTPVDVVVVEKKEEVKSKRRQRERYLIFKKDGHGEFEVKMSRRTKRKGKKPEPIAKYVGFCPQCDCVITNEDVLIHAGKILRQYFCFRCGKVIPVKEVKPLHSTWGEWFYVKEKRIIWYRVVAKTSEQAIEDVKHGFNNNTINPVGAITSFWKAKKMNKLSLQGSDLKISIRKESKNIKKGKHAKISKVQKHPVPQKVPPSV